MLCFAPSMVPWTAHFFFHQKIFLFFVEKDENERRRVKSYKKVTNYLEMLEKWEENRGTGGKD